jgi:hypothetical protein
MEPTSMDSVPVGIRTTDAGSWCVPCPAQPVHGLTMESCCSVENGTLV